MHNCLAQPDVDGDGSAFVRGHYSGLTGIFRKCITRLKYVITDSTRNEVRHYGVLVLVNSESGPQTRLEDLSGVALSPEVLAAMAAAEEAAAKALQEEEEDVVVVDGAAEELPESGDA